MAYEIQFPTDAVKYCNYLEFFLLLRVTSCDLASTCYGLWYRFMSSSTWLCVVPDTLQRPKGMTMFGCCHSEADCVCLCNIIMTLYVQHSTVRQLMNSGCRRCWGQRRPTRSCQNCMIPMLISLLIKEHLFCDYAFSIAFRAYTVRITPACHHRWACYQTTTKMLKLKRKLLWPLEVSCRHLSWNN